MSGNARPGIPLAALALLLAAMPASGEAVHVGAGTRLCGQFNSDYTDNPALAEGVYFSWAQGYLVGFSEAASGGRPDVDLQPGDFTTPRQRGFVRDFCRHHPQAAYMEAVEALFLRILDGDRRR